MSYFTSNTDAQNNTNAVGNTYVSSGNQTIYARINNPDTDMKNLIEEVKKQCKI